MNNKTIEELAIVSRLVGYSATEQDTQSAAFDKVAKVLPSKYDKSLNRYQQFLQGDDHLTNQLMPHGPYRVINQLADIVRQEQGNSAILISALQSTVRNTSAQVVEYWSGFYSLMSYLLAVLWITGAVLSIYYFKIMPTFSVTYDSLGQTMPMFTQLLFINGPAFYLILSGLLLIGLCIVIASRYLKTQIRNLQALNKILGQLPGFSLLRQSYSYFLFVNFAAALVEAKVDGKQALNQAENLSQFDPAPHREYQSWHDALVGAEHLGALEQELAFQCEHVGPLFARQLVKARESLTIFAQLVLACLIGAILIAMYLPIFQLGATF